MKTPPTNLVFVFADQMHGFALGCMGNPDVRTPNLDRLAAQGALFTTAYSCAPVCTPFRAHLFTGRYPSQTGARTNDARIPPGETTLADRMNSCGITTSYVGKWHLGGTGNVPVPEELRGGFQRFSGYQCHNEFLSDVVFYKSDGTPDRRTSHRTDATFDVAIEELGRLANRHFALFISEQAPHYPCQPAPEYASLYEGRPITLRPNFRPVDPYTPTWSPKSPPPDQDPVNLAYGGKMENYIRLYYAMVTQIDAQMGRLLAAIERLGIADHTAVVFTSDHGDMQGSHGLINKNSFHEESTRIPLIARIPGGARGTVCNTPVASADFFPTLLDIVGHPPAYATEGRSLLPTVVSGSEPEMREVFAEDFYQHWFMVRRGRWKLVVAEDDGAPTHLFNLETDPCEQQNLVDCAGHAMLIEALSHVIRRKRRAFAIDTASTAP